MRSWPTLTVVGRSRSRCAPLAGGRIYTYAEKYLGGGEGLSSAPRELPAVLPDDVDRAACRTWPGGSPAVALVRGVPRIDFLWRRRRRVGERDQHDPGFDGLLLLVGRRACRSPQLLTDMIAEAVRGPVRARPTDGADGTALRAAGSIAGKLA